MFVNSHVSPERFQEDEEEEVDHSPAASFIAYPESPILLK